MARSLPDTSMACPHCGAVDVSPLPGSTDTVSWYVCPQCREEWSVRFRGHCGGTVLIGREAEPGKGRTTS